MYKIIKFLKKAIEKNNFLKINLLLKKLINGFYITEIS